MSSFRGRFDHLAAFFAQYSTFNYNKYSSATNEFHRLCRHQGWKHNNPIRNAAHEAFSDALARQFNGTYGHDAGNLGSWQALCRRLDIPAPKTLVEARKVSAKFSCCDAALFCDEFRLSGQSL
jgi:hypothetical protein